MASLTAAGDVREGLDFAGAADGQARLDVESRRREERLMTSDAISDDVRVRAAHARVVLLLLCRCCLAALLCSYCRAPARAFSCGRTAPVRPIRGLPSRRTYARVRNLQVGRSE